MPVFLPLIKKKSCFRAAYFHKHAKHRWQAAKSAHYFVNIESLQCIVNTHTHKKNGNNVKQHIGDAAVMLLYAG
jgi:hypothetical protein